LDDEVVVKNRTLKTSDIHLFLHFLQAIAMSSGVVTPGSWVHVAVIYGGRQTGHRHSTQASISVCHHLEFIPL